MENYGISDANGTKDAPLSFFSGDNALFTEMQAEIQMCESRCTGLGRSAGMNSSLHFDWVVLQSGVT